MQNIKQFWINSYKLSPLAFYCEMIEAVFLISASAILSITILDPDGWHFVPLYLIGSMLGIISAIIRQAAFVIVLCSWFTAMNLYALVQLIGAL
ncbi:MAG: hypothetical protein ISQ22_07160 [Rhizobiales bacterium]|nr:hypothetical protein [Hyphomicrobiales bacterium]|tara:strand:+ start:1455 stop:1736 length:282 start_codon:yes stop_codon:yes gene_type:complete